MGSRYICIHGHFYQPPRENPWLEDIELQDSAYPFHDWNERISSECYAPNGAARILNDEGRIEFIVNNYSRMSYNFGPTLLAWMQEKDPFAYQAVIEADWMSSQRFGGHGSALAQAYNHMILPLAAPGDRRTQIEWGLRDFRHRFRREPEGMWLPETAVDLETLELLAEKGLTFTILAPRQAARVRPLDQSEDWLDVSGGIVDPTRAYVQKLPSGREISLFFYDGPISQAIAFEGLLARGDLLAERLTGAFAEGRDWAQLVHIATDGETYGHHHRHGEMALAYAFARIEEDPDVHLINYGAFLELHPPEWEVEIFENSSWSCVHGVERWRADCGCNTGGHPEWNQAWRGPLREALDWVRDELAPRYEEAAAELLTDPWTAREEYVELILDRSAENVAHFLEHQARRPLNEDEQRQALKLLELQRHAMLMYTSCGWFFDELSGIETTQVIMYAARALQLAAETLEHELEEGFLKRLEATPSNLPELGNGRTVYEKFIRPAALDLSNVAAHYAISSLFEEYGETSRIYAYEVRRIDGRTSSAGEARLLIGRARVESIVTRDYQEVSYGLLHFGDHNLSCGVREFRDRASFELLAREVEDAFATADLPEVIRLLDRSFGELTYSLRSLFRDEQRKILGIIMQAAVEEAETAYRQLYEHHTPLLYFLARLGIPGPEALTAPSSFVVNADLREALKNGPAGRDRIRDLLEVARRGKVELDEAGLSFAYLNLLDRLSLAFSEVPDDLETLEELAEAVSLVDILPFEVDLWNTQNRYYEVRQSMYPHMRARAKAGDEEAQEWLPVFLQLGEHLWIEPPPEQ
ncbi:MAG: DUF3536 domain-containing protein [Thermoleophilia bacterium]